MAFCSLLREAGLHGSPDGVLDPPVVDFLDCRLLLGGVEVFELNLLCFFVVVDLEHVVDVVFSADLAVVLLQDETRCVYAFADARLFFDFSLEVFEFFSGFVQLVGQLRALVSGSLPRLRC